MKVREPHFIVANILPCSCMPAIQNQGTSKFSPSLMVCTLRPPSSSKAGPSILQLVLDLEVVLKEGINVVLLANIDALFTKNSISGTEMEEDVW